ncbi:hypothetical protein KSP40_PGU005845 [Platanthera guangdongensis]|uniref:Uncharacterized protein n=1 Tax=Platanthera guangdongensis TaxID=2320717 RepID=A0ABR2LFE0_9ASPA
MSLSSLLVDAPLAVTAATAILILAVAVIHSHTLLEFQARSPPSRSALALLPKSHGSCPSIAPRRMDHASSVYKSQLAEPLPSKASHPSTKPHAQLLFLLDRASPTATPLELNKLISRPSVARKFGSMETVNTNVFQAPSNYFKGEPKEINFLGSSTFKGDADSYHLQTDYVDEPKEMYFKDDNICTSLPFEFCCVPDEEGGLQPPNWNALCRNVIAVFAEFPDFLELYDGRRGD